MVSQCQHNAKNLDMYLRSFKKIWLLFFALCFFGKSLTSPKLVGKELAINFCAKLRAARRWEAAAAVYKRRECHDPKGSCSCDTILQTQAAVASDNREYIFFLFSF